MIPDEIKTEYTSGKCFALAYAMATKFGWQIEGKIERYSDGAEYLAHAWVIHDSGQALDVHGLCDRRTMAESYGSAGGDVRQFSLDEFIEFCEVDDDDEDDTFWFDVEEACDVVETHVIPQYLSINTLPIQ